MASPEKSRGSSVSPARKPVVTDESEAAYIEQVKAQHEASQRAHRTSIARITEIESQYNGLLEQEKSKSLKAAQKLARVEADKERLNEQLNQMLESYKQLETSHIELMNGHS